MQSSNLARTLPRPHQQRLWLGHQGERAGCRFGAKLILLSLCPFVRTAQVVRERTERQHLTENLVLVHHFPRDSATDPDLTMPEQHRCALSAQCGRGCRCGFDAVDRCRRLLHVVDGSGRNCKCLRRPCFHKLDILVVCSGEHRDARYQIDYTPSITSSKQSRSSQPSFRI